MKNYEYKEPEFKVIETASEDILTASQNPVAGALNHLTDDWDTGAVGGGIRFGV